MLKSPFEINAALVVAVTLFDLGITGAVAQSQYPIMDKLAEKVLQKYQTSSCQQLAAGRGQKKSGKKEQVEERVVRLLHDDPQMRQAFLDQIAAPIANKMFECGMIP